METVNNLKSLFVAILLVLAGLISPSNGVDDRTNKTPLESLTIMFVAIIAGTTAYLVWNSIEKYKEASKTNHNIESQNSINSNI